MAILKTGQGYASTTEGGLLALATAQEHLAGIIDNKAASPAGVKAMLDQLIDGAPGLLDTLNELAAAIGDDANFAATTQTKIDNLQSQINTLSGTNLGNLTTEIDAIEAGAGLNTDGTYTAPTSTNYLSSASTLKGADVLLDAQIKQNADDIAALGNGNLSALQSEVDDIEASVGLQTDGTLGTYANTNNYSASATIKEAIEGVDAQVATNTAAISSLGSSAALTALQSELDTTQTSAGLNADGSLPAFTNSGGSNLPIIGGGSPATSLKDALHKIVNYVGQATLTSTNDLSDEVVAHGSEIDALTVRVGDNESDIASNTSAISSNDTDIAANVSAINTVEASVGLNADGSYSAISGANYATSSSSLKAAVAQVDTQLKSTQDDLDTLETTVSNLQTGAPNQSEVDAIEASVGINTDGSFSANTGGNFIASASSVRGEINALDTQLNTTQNDLDTAEASIVSNASAISAKADSSVVTSLSSTVDTVEASVGLTTSGGFTANSSGNYISSASSVRGEINALDSQVSTNAGDISNLSSTVSTLTAGGGANSTQITALQSELDQTQTGAGLGTTGAYSANSGSNYIGSATSLKDADNKLDAQIKTNADAIALKASSSDLTALTTRVTTAESDITSLESDMSSAQSDITANTTAISSNDSDISALQSGKADTSVTSALQSELDATQASAGINANGSFTAPTSTNYLGSITTLKGGLSTLDTQIKTNADAISSNDSDISSNASDISTNASAINTVEASVGLSASGAYQAPSSSNYLSSASSVRDADSKLDAQIKTNADAIAAEITNRSNADTTINSSISTLQSEVDATQTGAGLTSAGAYTANTGATYIASSTSLKDADDDLDAAIAANASAISSNDSDISSINSTLSTLATSSSLSALQSEVDATQAGVGLAANGSYSAISGANYATSSSSLKAAVTQLDTQLKTTQDALDVAEAAIASNDTDIATNVSAINTVEASVGLSTAGAYISRSGTNYLDSATSVINEATLLDAQIATNATAIATKAASSTVTALQSEVDTSQSSIGLSSSGGYVSRTSTNYLNSATSIVGEITALDTQAKTNADAISSESSSRASADSTLTSAINTVEASVGLQADGSLSISGTNFLNSSSTIVAALDTLDTNQKLLSDIRLNMISALGLSSTGTKNSYANTNYISDSEDVIEAIEALDRQVSTNAGSISSLGSGNIANLQSELDATQSGAGLGTDGTYSANSSTNYLTSVSTLKAADEALDTQIKTNADAIALKANSTTLSALDLRVTQLENSDGGLFSDDSSNDEVHYNFKVEELKSHLGPFEIKLGGANGYIRALVASENATTDLIFYGSKAERDGDRHFHVHPTSGDGIFQGKFSS